MVLPVNTTARLKLLGVTNNMLETICEVMSDAYKRNWITSRDGNASIRHQDRDHFYVTPTGVRKQTMQPDQFKKNQNSKCACAYSYVY